MPDAKTVWLYREALAKAGMVDELFAQSGGYLARQGHIARGGQILDASIVPVPRNHNKREENAAIKAGETPEGWADKPARQCQKDVDARWTRKHGKSHCGCKNHINVDRPHQLIRRYHVTDAAVHDSQAVDQLLTRGNTGSGVRADAAYRSAEIEAVLKARKLTSHSHRKGQRGKPPSQQAQNSNRTKSAVRVRVEHIFGAQANDMGGTLVRTIGLVRAKARIGMKNLACNMRRLGTGPPEPMPGMTEDRPETLIRLRRGTHQAKDTARQPQNHPPARLSPVHCQLQTARPKLQR